jgi:hypothetical protein
VATFDTFGSDFDTLLGVYLGSGVDALTYVLGNDDSGYTLQSKVTFNAVIGTTYYVAVDGDGGQGGRISLNWTERLPPISTAMVSLITCCSIWGRARRTCGT